MMLENRKDNLRIESVNTMSEFEKPPDFIFINPRHYIEEKSNCPFLTPGDNEGDDQLEYKEEKSHDSINQHFNEKRKRIKEGDDLKEPEDEERENNYKKWYDKYQCTTFWFLLFYKLI